MSGRTVIVTGGSGKLGRAVVEELAGRGDRVIVLDAVPSHRPDAAFTRVDLADSGAVLEAFLHIDSVHAGRIDALVHLAAVPGPGRATDAVTYLNNTACSFNVFQAARHAGIRNIVFASSETLLGVPFDTPPPYLPVDEDVPSTPEWSYALSKLVDEAIAAQFCRWDPALKMIGLRFSNVMEEGDYASFPGFDADLETRKWNLWAYIDARDGAQAVRLALDHESAGFDTFVIANADTVMRRANAELLAAVFPDVPLKRAIESHESLLSIEKARRVLGFAPRHGWREPRLANDQQRKRP